MKLAVFSAACLALASRALPCCAVAPAGSQVVNADQTVIILWDEAAQTQHFIRRADFKTYAADIGFIVPSPSRPQLDESGGETFSRLRKITALKVAKGDRTDRSVKADSLRISFRTDRPLFPYREPDSATSARNLETHSRLLRIYLIAHARYRGEIDGGLAWSGKAVWSGDITSHREALLRDLGLPSSTGPARWWLTEFEDRWPYAKAAGDVYFSRDRSQRELRRQAAAVPQDAAFLATLAICCVMPLRRKRIP